MPLHLLGKKSWNVYNPENIARVRRDEAQAQAREAEQERREQQIDAERRIGILRGERSSVIPEHATRLEDREVSRDRHRTKRRRLPGEDDTDRDIRLAQADAISTNKAPEHGSLFDEHGHIDLIPTQNKKRIEKSVESEEAATRRTKAEYAMRFSDASGTHADAGKPWYTASDTNTEVPPGRDVWGNEDPLRRDREAQRLNAKDPLAAMKAGVKQLREAEKHRREWMEQRERDLKEVEDIARREQRKKRGGSTSDADSLEDFDLDKGYDKGSNIDSNSGRRADKPHRHRHHHHRHRDRHHRSRSPGHHDHGQRSHQTQAEVSVR